MQISVEEAISARSSEERTAGFSLQNETSASKLSSESSKSHKDVLATHFEVREPVTPGSRSITGLGASSHSLVPVNIPIDIETDPMVMEILGEQPANQRQANERTWEEDMEIERDSTGDYQEMYHTSMGHLFTVKTKDMEL